MVVSQRRMVSDERINSKNVNATSSRYIAFALFLRCQFILKKLYIYSICICKIQIKRRYFHIYISSKTLLEAQFNETLRIIQSMCNTLSEYFLS